MRLDNAAKIYPAARNENWSNIFRLSVTLTENIDRDILADALAVTAKRFPSIAVRLRRGIFWYYLEELDSPIEIRDELSYPLSKMSKRETRKCALRVLTYKNRIALEVFHSLTDGTGALIFLKTLTAEYIERKHNVKIGAGCGVLDRNESPSEDELEDSFGKNVGNIKASRADSTAWRVTGTPEDGGFLNLTCVGLNVKEALDAAHSHGVTLTVFLSAILMESLQEWQKEKVENIRKRKPIKLLIPVNLRSIFESKTLRNFAFYTTPELLTALGEYSFDEICKVITHKMGAEVNAKHMSMNIAKNVGSERMTLVRIMPLFVKNFVMKAIYDAVGERTSCLSFSNLGNVALPDEMKTYVERFDFILGVQSTVPYNCSAISYGGKLYMSFIRGVKESELEAHFHRALIRHGLSCEIESNRSSKKGE